MVEQLRYMPESEQYARVADILRETFPEPSYGTEDTLDENRLHLLLEDQPNREKHSLGVSRLANSLGQYLKRGKSFTDDLGMAGKWHDVAYSKLLQQPTGYHPVDGAVFLAQYGVPNRVVSAVLFHSGAKEEAKLLFPENHPVNQLYEHVGFYRPTLIDHSLVVSDLQTAHDGSKVISIENRIVEIIRRTQNPHIENFLHMQYHKFKRSQDILLQVGGVPVKNLLRR